MKAISLNTVRWAMVGMQVALLGGVIWVAVLFFWADRDDLDQTPTDSGAFVVAKSGGPKVDVRVVASLISLINEKPPVQAPVASNIPVIKDLGPRAGGPLASTWKVNSTWRRGAETMAAIQEKAAAPPPGRTTRATRSRSSSRRTARRSSGRSKVQKSRVKSLRAGQAFVVGDDVYLCEQVDVGQRRVIYRDKSGSFFLDADKADTTVSRVEGAVLVSGKDKPEEDGATAAFDPEKVGSIRFADEAISGLPNSDESDAASSAPVRRPTGRGLRAGKRRYPTRRRVTPTDVRKVREALDGASTADKEKIKKALEEGQRQR